MPNKLRGPHCGDLHLIHFILKYSATTKLSTKLCVLLTLQVIWAVIWSFYSPSNANRLSTSEAESETELEIKKEAIQNQKILT